MVFPERAEHISWESFCCSVAASRWLAIMLSVLRSASLRPQRFRMRGHPLWLRIGWVGLAGGSGAKASGSSLGLLRRNAPRSSDDLPRLPGDLLGNLEAFGHRVWIYPAWLRLNRHSSMQRFTSGVLVGLRGRDVLRQSCGELQTPSWQYPSSADYVETSGYAKCCQDGVFDKVLGALCQDAHCPAGVLWHGLKGIAA